MLFTAKKSFLYQKVLTILLILNFNTFSYAKYATNKLLPNESKVDDLLFEYIDNDFNPFQISNTYLKSSIWNIDLLIDVLKLINEDAKPQSFLACFNKELNVYLDVGMEIPSHQYMNYTLGMNILAHKSITNNILAKFFPTFANVTEIFKGNGPIISMDCLLGIKFKAPIQLNKLYIAPYIHLMGGPSIFRSISPSSNFFIDYFFKSNSRFAMSGVFAVGIDIFINQWIGIFGEIQNRVYKYPEQNIRYLNPSKLITYLMQEDKQDNNLENTVSTLKFPNTNYQSGLLFVFGIRTTF